MSRAVPWPVFCLAPLPGRRRLGMPSSGGTRRNREGNLRYLTNNMRFLILPWVRVPHLASHILSRIARRHQSTDWEREVWTSDLSAGNLCRPVLVPGHLLSGGQLDSGRPDQRAAPAMTATTTIQSSRSRTSMSIPWIKGFSPEALFPMSCPGEKTAKRPGPKRKPPLREEEVQGFEYYWTLFFKALGPVS